MERLSILIHLTGPSEERYYGVHTMEQDATADVWDQPAWHIQCGQGDRKGMITLKYNTYSAYIFLWAYETLPIITV